MSNSWISIDPVFPLWEVIITIFPVFAFFIWKELKRNLRFLASRIVAQALILLSILGLLLRPFYAGEQVPHEIMLLTHGYDQLKADSVLKENPTLKILRSTAAARYLQSEIIPSAYNLKTLGNTIRFILGEGLPYYALEIMDQNNFHFIPGKIPVGITQITIPNILPVNHTSVVRGIFNAEGNTKLVLNGPSGAEDSIIITHRGFVPFALSFKPKQAGLFIYTITGKSSAEVLIAEKLPIKVIPERKLKILFLQKFPTAEVRNLKNYLAEKGHALALRYQTSKNNFKYEYNNLTSMRIDRLTPDLTESFDLIFLDSDVLDELSASENAVLEKSIHAGLGLIVLLNAVPGNGNKLYRLFPVSTKLLAKDTVHIRFSDSKLYALTALPIEITPDPTIQPVTRIKERILSGYKYHGFGKVAFQLLRETYRIRLEGNASDYASVWSSLIERTARTKNEMFKIKIKNPFPYYPDEPLNVDVISSGRQPSLSSDGTLMSLTEDVVLDDEWHGNSWAGKPGWHQFLAKQDSSHLDYFVSNIEEWKALRIANQAKENELAQMSSPVVLNGEEKEIKTVPPLLFYLIFLFSAGFLWLAPKL